MTLQMIAWELFDPFLAYSADKWHYILSGVILWLVIWGFGGFLFPCLWLFIAMCVAEKRAPLPDTWDSK